MSAMNIMAKTTLQDKQLHCIGAGACGSVWSTNNYNDDKATSTVLKREDGAKGRSLLNDYQVHLSVIHALPRCPESIRTAFRIPQCHGFFRPGEHTRLFLQRFPLEQQQSCNILVSQRIPPLSKMTRDLLCDKYCPPSFLDQIKADPRSVDCLIRPYLGRRRDPGNAGRQSKFQSFSLQNHVVSIDQMDDLGITADMKEQYAAAMAKALAFMHWCARIDADDVEPLSMYEAGIALAQKAFYRNDLYYPRPARAHPEDQRLWLVFKRSFLEASLSILRSDASVASDIPNDLPSQADGSHRVWRGWAFWMMTR
ncbi:hypothetical protein PG994_014516 [Apiospora phragmitis]|uniref:DUF3669 domain-containing protein n=1 Tax=Apiospora phragmitis TaxID=2905665 RepID=A0ABR1T6K8_9PEZI